MPLTKLCHLFYVSIKEAKENYGKPVNKLKNKLHFLLFGYCFSRTLTCMIEVSMQGETSKLDYLISLDYASFFFTDHQIILKNNNTEGSHINSSQKTYNVLFFFQLLLLTIFNLFYLNGFYQSGAPGRMALDKFYYYIIQNIDQFKSCENSRSKIGALKNEHYKRIFEQYSTSKIATYIPFTKLLFSALAKFQSSVLLYKRMELFDMNKLEFSCHLNPHFHIPLPLRVSLYWLTLAFDSQMFVFQLFVCKYFK